MDGEAGGSAAVLREEALLFVPQGLGEIHVIVMRVLEAEHLVPHRVHLFRAVAPDFLDPRKVVDTGSLPEKLLLQRHRPEVFDRLAFPDMVGIENLIRRRIVDRLLPQGQYVRDGLAGFPVKKPPQIFEAGVGDFGDVFADLDAGEDGAVPFHGRKLVNPSENGGARRRDQPFAHAEAVHLGALADHVADDILGGSRSAAAPH